MPFKKTNEKLPIKYFLFAITVNFKVDENVEVLQNGGFSLAHGAGKILRFLPISC